MPYADKEKNKALRRAWNKRNPERIRAAKARWRARRRRLREATRVIIAHPYVKVTADQDKHFRKLRRSGVPLRRAQIEAYGLDWIPPNQPRKKYKWEQ